MASMVLAAMARLELAKSTAASLPEHAAPAAMWEWLMTVTWKNSYIGGCN